MTDKEHVCTCTQACQMLDVTHNAFSGVDLTPAAAQGSARNA